MISASRNVLLVFLRLDPLNVLHAIDRSKDCGSMTVLSFIGYTNNMTEQPHSNVVAVLWSPRDRRDILRELIVHEDKLTTERIQALYTMQGFLFASFGLLAGKSFPPSKELGLITTVFSVVGFTAALGYLQELSFNTKAITDLMKDWEALRAGCIEPVEFPKIIGHYTLGARTPRFLPRKTIPIMFMCIWFVVLILIWWKPMADIVFH